MSEMSHHVDFIMIRGHGRNVSVFVRWDVSGSPGAMLRGHGGNVALDIFIVIGVCGHGSPAMTCRAVMTDVMFMTHRPC